MNAEIAADSHELLQQEDATWRGRLWQRVKGRPWLRKLLKRFIGRDPFYCYVNISDENLASSLQKRINKATHPDMEVRIFGAHRASAIQLITRKMVADWPSRDETAHYVIFGFGDMGRTTALQLARFAHFPNRRRCFTSHRAPQYHIR